MLWVTSFLREPELGAERLADSDSHLPRYYFRAAPPFEVDNPRAAEFASLVLLMVDNWLIFQEGEPFFTMEQDRNGQESHLQ